MISKNDKNQISEDIKDLTDSYKKISSDIETRLSLLNKVSEDLKAFNQGPFSKYWFRPYTLVQKVPMDRPFYPFTFWTFSSFYDR